MNSILNSLAILDNVKADISANEAKVKGLWSVYYTYHKALETTRQKGLFTDQTTFALATAKLTVLGAEARLAEIALAEKKKASCHLTKAPLFTVQQIDSIPDKVLASLKGEEIVRLIKTSELRPRTLAWQRLDRFYIAACRRYSWGYI